MYKMIMKIKKDLNVIKSFFQKLYLICSKPEMAILPGQLAFFSILSLVPICSLIGYGASIFNISINSLIEIIRSNLNTNVANTIIPIISGQSLDYKLVIILIIMFYLSSNGSASIIFTANQICGFKQTSWIKRRLKAILLTLIIIVLFIFILIVSVYGKQIVSTLDYFGFKSTFVNIIEIMRGPISWLVIFGFIKLIIIIAPDGKIDNKKINQGSLFTTIGFIITTNIYSYYINHFARYDLFYAGLSNIAILMLWFYFLSYLFVIGLSFTATLPKTGNNSSNN